MASQFPIEPIAAVTPRALAVSDEKPEIRQRVWGLDARTDATVSYAEFTYWAKIERAEEMATEQAYRLKQGPWSFKKFMTNRFDTRTVDTNTVHPVPEVPAHDLSTDEKNLAREQDGDGAPSLAVSEEEWKTAARAMRTATWGSIFFLVTTDILGWSGCPFVFASVGYGPGIAIYIIFGLAAAAAGYFLWKVFMSLDSSRYPMLSYGDLFLRVYGPKTRHFINITQSIQQFCTVMVLILGSGQVISQLAGPGLCFIVCMLIVTIVGIICGSVRTLQKMSFLCNFSVWLNIVSFIIIMAASAKYGIDYSTVHASTLIKTVGNIKTFTGIPPNAYQQQAPGFAGVFNGIDSMVYAYSGALLFVAFMAEMRHPMDFWKGMILAQGFICVVYILFGAYVYSNFGQYAASNIYQVIEPFSLQTVSNVFSLLTGMIACILYFNIGMKTVYLEVFEEIFHFPNINTKKGKWMWLALGPLYWIIAFLIAAAVPNLNGIVSMIGGLLALNFTYAFPGAVFVGYQIHEGAVQDGEGFDPHTGLTTYHDSGIKRWTRGFFNRWYLTIPTVIYSGAALACSGMGTWAAVEGLISIFGPGGTVATSYGCASPVWS